MISNGHLLNRKNGRMMGASPRYAMFNIFLPEVDDPNLGDALQWKINELVVETGATGYTLLPPSDGLWVHGDSVVEDRVHPMQIVAEDTAHTREQIEQFAVTAAALLGQQWLYVFRVPVVVNKATCA
jgi:hypothetical protein